MAIVDSREGGLAQNLGHEEGSNLRVLAVVLVPEIKVQLFLAFRQKISLELKTRRLPHGAHHRKT